MSNANANVNEEISETYSNTMTEAMGAGKLIHSMTSCFRLYAWLRRNSWEASGLLYMLEA